MAPKDNTKKRTGEAEMMFAKKKKSRDKKKAEMKKLKDKLRYITAKEKTKMLTSKEKKLKKILLMKINSG